MVGSFQSPPLRSLCGVGYGFEDAGWRSGDKYLRQDRVLIRSDLRCCHLCPRCDGFASLQVRLQPEDNQVPAVGVVRGLFGIACESGMCESQERSAILDLKFLETLRALGHPA